MGKRLCVGVRFWLIYVDMKGWADLINLIFILEHKFYHHLTKSS